MTYKRIKCWFHGHTPIIREDMKFEIPYREVKVNDSLIMRIGGRIFKIGDTSCARCGCCLRVEGVIVRELKG
jgi:hypothetical protein